MKFDKVEFASVEVTDRTTWTHALFTDGDGLEALVEITSGDATRDVADQTARMVAELRRQEATSEAEIVALLGLEERSLSADRTLGTAVSALRTAAVQIEAEHRGVSLTEMLGGKPQNSVELYANINRALFASDRSPAAFGRMAERAAQAGFRVFKCAPFDEVRRDVSSGLLLKEAGPGLERVAAVREAIGPDSRLLVDCHNRFDPEVAVVVAERLAELGVAWFEEPVHSGRTATDLAWLAKRIPMPLVAGENEYGVEAFAELVNAGGVSVIMPDVKHCGGVGEAVSAGRWAVAAGAGFSPHCPTGPVSLLASGHVTAAVEGAMPLEHAVYEVDWRSALLDPPERVEGGRLWLPGGSGLGARLNDAVTDKFGWRWKP